MTRTAANLKPARPGRKISEAERTARQMARLRAALTAQMAADEARTGR